MVQRPASPRAPRRLRTDMNTPLQRLRNKKCRAKAKAKRLAALMEQEQRDAQARRDALSTAYPWVGSAIL